MISAATHIYSNNDLWTLGIAAYAALVSTFVLGWDAYKWLAAGARIELSASMNMKLMGGITPDPKTYISVTAYNVGDRPTTITNLGGMYYESWWNAYISRRKPTQAFIVTEPSQTQRIPYRFDVGDQWIGLADQTEDIVRMSQNGYLFLILYITGGGRGYRVRLNFKHTNQSKRLITTRKT